MTTKIYVDGLTPQSATIKLPTVPLSIQSTLSVRSALRIPTQAQAQVTNILGVVATGSLANLAPSVAGTLVDVGTTTFKNAATNAVFSGIRSQISGGAATLGISQSSVGPIVNGLTNTFVSSLSGTIQSLSNTQLNQTEYTSFQADTVASTQAAVTAATTSEPPAPTSFRSAEINAGGDASNAQSSTATPNTPTQVAQSTTGNATDTNQAVSESPDPTGAAATTRQQEALAGEAPAGNSELTKFRQSEIREQNATNAPLGSDPDFGKVYLVPTLSPGDRYVFKSQPRISTADSATYTEMSPTHMPTSFVFFKGNPVRTFNITDIKLFSRTFEEASENLRDLNKLRSWLKPYFGIVGSGDEGEPTPAVNQASAGETPPVVQTATEPPPNTLETYSDGVDIPTTTADLRSPAVESEPTPQNATPNASVATPVIANNERVANPTLAPANAQPQASDHQNTSIDSGRAGAAPSTLSTNSRSVRNQQALLSNQSTSDSSSYTDAAGNFYGSYESPTQEVPPIVASNTAGNKFRQSEIIEQNKAAQEAIDAAQISRDNFRRGEIQSMNTTEAAARAAKAQAANKLSVEAKMLGAPPMVLYLYGYSDAAGAGPQNINKIPVVIESISYDYPNDVDYIPTSEGVPFPAMMTLSMSLKEAHSPREVEAFDIVAFKQGRMVGW